MSTIEINTPDGKMLQLNAPDGATPDQIHSAAIQAAQHYSQNFMQKPPMSIEGFSRNALKDYGSNIQANAELGAYAFPPLAAMKIAQGKNIYDPGRLASIGKGMLEGIKSIPGQLLEEANHPIESFYQRPLSTTLDIGNVAGIGTEILDGIRTASRSVALKMLPRTFAKTAGIPERATSEVLSNPEILKRIAPTENEIQQHAVNVLNSLKKAKEIIGNAHGDIYRKYAGMESPMQDIVNTPIAQNIIPTKSDIPIAQELIRTEVPRDIIAGKTTDTRFVPGKLINEQQTTGFKAGDRFTLPDGITPWEKVLINKEDVDLAFKHGDTDALERLYKEYVGSEKSSIQSSDITNQDKLQILSRLKRESSQYANFFKQTSPNSVTPIDSANSAAAKNIATEISSLRSNLPNGQKLAAADKGYEALNQIYNDLQQNLATPGKAEDTLFKLYKRDMSAITAGKTAEKLSSIRRLESITQKKILQPVFDAFTRREFDKGIGKGLSHTLLEGGAAGTAMTGLMTGHPLASAAAIGAGLAGSPKAISLGLRGANAVGSGIKAASRFFNLPPLLVALLTSHQQVSSGE